VECSPLQRHAKNGSKICKTETVLYKFYFKFFLQNTLYVTDKADFYHNTPKHLPVRVLLVITQLGLTPPINRPQSRSRAPYLMNSG